MSAVRCQISVPLDGFFAGTNQGPEIPAVTDVIYRVVR
jgi:hypothetical protein